LLCAGLQQFKQAALAYVLLAAADRPLDAGQVAAAAEAVLQQRLQLQVCFNADEALAELRRFGLLVEQQQQQQGHTEQQQQQGVKAGSGPQHQQQTVQREGQGVVEAALAAAAAAAGALRGPAAAAAAAAAPSAAGTAVAVAKQSQSVTVQAPQQQQQQRVLYKVLDSREAQQVLQQYWAGLLRQRVRSILQAV
jgi:hypothetical protein